jgi:hypothetical protein
MTSNPLSCVLPGFKAGVKRGDEWLRNAVLAAFTAATLLWLGPPGIDTAAHVYQRGALLAHGFSIWNNFWYSGRYSFVNYSLIYYPLSIAGIRVLGLISIAVAAVAFTEVVLREFGPQARWSARVFALVWGAFVLSGAFPFMLGAALALVSLWLLQRGRRRWFAASAILTLLASPLAFAFLLVVLTGLWLTLRSSVTERRRLRAPLYTILAISAAGALLLRLFPDSGHFPFSLGEFAAAVAFCVAGLFLTWRLERARLLRFIFAVYLAACALAFILPSTLGGNVTRLRFAALPLMVLVLSLRRWRPLLPALCVLVLATSWNLTPLASSYARASSDASSNALYWQPAITFLKGRLTPDYRVEAVDTLGHWDAAYLPAAGIPLVRGWFRQDDFPQNQLLYQDGRLNPARYLSWLRQLGVRYVVLSDAPSDYSAKDEATLLRSGRSGLVAVFRSQHLVVFSVPRPRPLLTGPAGKVTRLGQSTISLSLQEAGRYRLAVRYSPYWHSSHGCVSKGQDGFLRLTAPRGQVKLSFVLSADNALAALGGTSPSCAEQTGG